MTDKVRPSLNAPGKRHEVATTIAAAGASPGWVVAAGEDYLAGEDPDLNEGAMNAFAESSSGSSLDVTIDAGEGFVEGAWVARDVATTVTLAASTAGQTVYLGWDKSSRDTVIIGLAGDFASDDRKIPLYDFDTDGSGVTSVTDRRVQNLLLETTTFDGDVEINNGHLNLGGNIRPIDDWLDVTGLAGGFTFKNAGGTNILVGRSGGTIEVTSGDFEVSSGHIYTKSDGGWGRIYSSGLGNTAVQIYDRANSRAILNAYEGGDAAVPHGKFTVGNGDLVVDPVSNSSPKHRMTATADSGTYTATYELNSAALTIGHNSSNRDIHLETDNIRALRLTSGQHVYIENGDLQVHGRWRSHQNAHWDIEFANVDGTTHRGLNIGTTNGRFLRLGSRLGAGSTHQYDYVFTRSNGESGNTAFGITYSNDGGSSWQPLFEVLGTGDVAIGNGDLTVTNTSSGAAVISAEHTGTSDADAFVQAKANDGGEAELQLFYQGTKEWIFGTGEFYDSASTVAIRHAPNGRNVVEVASSGDVELLHGGLTSHGNIRIEGTNPPMYIANSTDVSADRRVFSAEHNGTEQWALMHDVAGDDAFTIADATDGYLDVLSLKLGGDIVVPNGGATVAGTITAQSDVSVSGDVSATNVTASGDIETTALDPVAKLPQTVKVVEDFESRSLSAYTKYDNGNASIETGAALRGAYGLDIFPSVNDAVYGDHIVSTSGLAAYFGPGTKLIGYVNRQDNRNAGIIHFGVQSETSNYQGYYVLLSGGNHDDGEGDIAQTNELGLLDGDGTRTVLDDIGFIVQEEQYVRIEIEWHTNGDINVQLTGLSSEDYSLSANDTTHTDGGIGFGASYNNADSGSATDSVVFDEFEVWPL